MFAIPTWLTLPRAARDEAWRRALHNEAHPDPAIQAAAVGWHRVAGKAQAGWLVLVIASWVAMVVPDRRVPGFAGWAELATLISVVALMGVTRWSQRLARLAAPNLWMLAATHREPGLSGCCCSCRGRWFGPCPT